MDVGFEWDSDESPEVLAARLEAYDDALDERLFEAMETLGAMIISTSKTLVPVDSGRLRSSLAYDVEREGQNEIVLYVGSNISYAPIIEYGRGAIHADPGEVLHFYVEGQEVFTTSVGPAAAQPFLRPSIQEHKPDFKRLLKQATREAAKDVGLA